jgi:hypothetical protein
MALASGPPGARNRMLAIMESAEEILGPLG